MHLNGTTDNLLGERVSFPLSVLAALFVEIPVHLIGKIPHKDFKTRPGLVSREQETRFDTGFA
jgi:hypothetical protein